MILTGLPAAVLLLLLLWWIEQSGGFSPSVWYPSALLALALAGWLFFLRPARLSPDSPAAARGLALFAALVGLNYLSVLWSASPGNALDSANKLALYLVVAWVMATLTWTPRRLAVALALWSGAVTLGCALALIDAASASDVTSFFVDGRFSDPMQYSNATGALAVMGLWPALILSSRREVPAWARAVLLAMAAFLAGFAVLPESRGALLGLAVTVPVALVTGHSRIRLAGRIIIAGGAAALAVPRALAIERAVSAGRGVHDALAAATTGLAIAAAAALVVGAVLVWIENRWDARHPVRPTARRGSGPWRRRLAIGAGILVVVATAAATPTVIHTVSTAVRNGNTDASVGSNRLTSISPEERFDYARVALHVFVDHPVFGVGAGNFGRQYDAQRHFLKHSAYTHDIALRVLAETGGVGLLVFLALLTVLIAGLLARLRGDTLGRAGVAAAVTIAVYFLLHGSLDWLDQFPALAAAAIAFPLAALGLRRERTAVRARTSEEAVDGGSPRARRHRRVGRLPVRLAGAALAIGLLVVLGSGYLAGTYVDRSFAVFRSDPAAAFHDLRLAHAIDPLSADPLTTEGTIALYLGNRPRAIDAFQRSLAREDAWYPRLELGLLYGSAGRFSAAARELAAARRLDASDPAIAQAAREVAARRGIDPIAFNRTVSQEGDVGGATVRLH